MRDVVCPFCDLPDSRVVLANDLAFVLRDAYPVSPGHTLVIPRRHVASYADVKPAEREAMFALLDLARHELAATFAVDGFNIGINDGRAAGQTVMHVHMHLIPRFVGDVADPRGGVRWVIPAKARYWD
ncbi:HIT family protein [Pseudazoarcus pumilus]|uniref:HIT family protein n=1 Tax=Pseudazoarcus pumilus TaxID=2067960 RepID=A0A2I6S7J3_9RHOO|nr:HIT domain-containing protein [Pseudazoarcus pumilus]AUN95224.1 HIT family protein [Pseudazoarcus pumilus]